MRALLTLLFVLVSLLGLPGLAHAQDNSEDDKTFLEGKLQDLLSGAGRSVVISGFEGALSSNARLDSLTIADDDGIWLTMRGASLVWSRAALLRGRLSVEELTADKITLTRLPKASGGVSVEDSQATEFSLPDLPVSVQIDVIRAANIVLEQPVMGERATLSLEGGLALDDGAGNAKLEIQRLDRADSLTFDGGFSNETRVLRIDLDFFEAADGLVAKLLRIPDTPALDLTVKGDAPLDDFTATMALASDGQRRFGGTVNIAALPADGPEGYGFGADLDGDVRLLFPPDLQPFFGEATQLSLAGQTLSDGRLKLDQLNINSQMLSLTGSLSLSANRWPQTLALTGEIGAADGTPVRLPLSGPPTTLTRAQITAGFDAARDETWQADIIAENFSRDGFDATRAHLAGTGQITRSDPQQLIADITFDTTALRHTDPALSRAIGRAPQGRMSLNWQAGQPLEITSFTASSGDVTLIGEARIDGLSEALPITGKATLDTADLSRFAPLAGRDLAGAARATLSGSVTLLEGAFDVDVQADTRDLRVDEARLDPLLSGPGALSIKARRDTTGTALERLAITTDAITATASGTLTPETGQLSLKAALDQIARVEPRLTGPATLDTALGWTVGQSVDIDRLLATAAGATLTASGAVWPEETGLPARGQALLEASDLSQLAALAGQPLAGKVRLELNGQGQITGQKLDLQTTLSGTSLRSGIADLDKVLGGRADMQSDFAIGDGLPDLRQLTLNTARLSVNATGSGPGAPISLATRLDDLGQFLTGFSGPATARGSVTLRDRMARDVGLALDVTGPGGVTARVEGDMRDYGQNLGLSANGRAPMALANRFIAPRSLSGQAEFALRVAGPPALSSLSGTVDLAGGRLALPKLGTALDSLRGALRLEAGRVRTDITGTAGKGGSFRLTGPITLSAPYNGTLSATLNALGVVDPNLYQTDLNGTVLVDGPLAGGARISGTINLGRTELRVPSGGGISLGEIPEIRHVGAPRAVQETRARAGLTGQAGQSERSLVSYPLALRINAPRRIFVRGRGLDAELGGVLRLGGTTTNVSASGTFELIRGRLDILGKRLDLTEGLINLRGALDPYLRFVAETQSDDISVRVILEGLASAPSVTFESEPDLPQEEVVARLLFGRGLDSISAFQAAQLVAAAATLSGKRSGGFLGGFRDATGLSDFDVTTTADGATQVSAGAYLTENIYSEVTADSEGNQEINLKIDVGRFVTLQGGTDSTGNTGVGVFFEKDY